jgi:hypothetical protein
MRFRSNSAVKALLLLPCLVFYGFFLAAQQNVTVDGQNFNRYNRRYFSPHRGLFYTIYVSPVLTVDPLGFGGKSTYGIALGSRIRLWESKTPDNSFTGLKIAGLYTALAYEYYPKQYDKIYASLWLRVKSFIPLAGRADYIYAKGYGLSGISYRFGVGTEVKGISLFVCGEYYFSHALGGPHPNSESPYTNAGEILAVIPIFTRKEK